MLGALCGDIVGSAYEWNSTKNGDFTMFAPGTCFTDDTVLTTAVASALLDGTDYGESIIRHAERYPDAGYGNMFQRWVKKGDMVPYGSFGNGSAMRVSPVGWAFETLEQTLIEARKTAEVTHDHPEGIKGAMAVAGTVYLARRGFSKHDITVWITEGFDYDLDRTVEDIRPHYDFDETCSGTVPEALVCFLDADSWEKAVRNAVSLGGDADTLGCITGAVGEAYWGHVPERVAEKAMALLDPVIRDVLCRFRLRYGFRRAARPR